MKHLFFLVSFVSAITFVSIFADAFESKQELNIADFEDARIEVGFSLEKESEPHMVVLVKGGKPLVSQIEESQTSKNHGRQIASADETKLNFDFVSAKPMSPDVFDKRMRDMMTTDLLSSHQLQVKSKRKSSCKDEYILKIRVSGKYRDYRGCVGEKDDKVGQFANDIYRDAFLSYYGRGAK